MINLRENHEEFMKNNKLIVKSQQTFRSEYINAFNKEVHKIVLSANDDKRMQSINSIERYAYVTNNEIIHRKEDIKCNNIIKQYEK